MTRVKRTILLYILLFYRVGQLKNKTVAHGNNAHISDNSVLGFGIEHLLLAAAHRHRFKADILCAGDRQPAIADLVTVASHIKTSVAPFISGQLRLAFEFFRVVCVFGKCLGVGLELLGNDLPLALCTCCRRHCPVIRCILLLESCIKLLTRHYRQLVEYAVAQDVSSAIAELSRQTAQTMTSFPVRMAPAYHRSFRSLKLMHFSYGAHSVFNLKVHLIFVVAYRRRAISARILTRLEEIFTEVCLHFGATLLEFSGEPDHVHLLIEYAPTVRLCDLIRTFKAVSALRIRTEFHSEIRHMLWGKRFWTRSYCAISVGDGATTAIIERYIQSQNRPK